MKSDKDIKKDPFEEYLRESEPTHRESVYYWQTAIGLQAVDGLETSDYLKETAKSSIEGSISIEKAQELIEREAVIVDGRTAFSGGYDLKPGARVSVRGFGKFIYDGVISNTKKGRFFVRVKIFR